MAVAELILLVCAFRVAPIVGVVLCWSAIGCSEVPLVRPGAAAAPRDVCETEPLVATSFLLGDRAALASSVTDVRVEGTMHVPNEIVRVLMTKTPGASLEPSQLEGAETRLLALGALDSVRFRRSTTTVIVDARERPRVSRVRFVGNATPTAIRAGLAPQAGDVFDRDVLIDTANAIEHSWRDFGEAVPRVTIHARRAMSDEIDLCVRATALDPYRIDKAVDEIERLRLEEVATRPVSEISDRALAAYVAEIGSRAASTIGPAVRDATFVVTDSASVDGVAEAKPNRVTISRGLLGAIDTEAQLAAVLAHELGHLLLRHGVVDDLTRAVGLKAGPNEAASWEAYQQMQADRVAIDALERLGYDPHEFLVALGALLTHSFEENATVSMATYSFARLSRIRLLLHGRSGGRIERAAYRAQIDHLP